MSEDEVLDVWQELPVRDYKDPLVQQIDNDLQLVSQQINRLHREHLQLLAEIMEALAATNNGRTALILQRITRRSAWPPYVVGDALHSLAEEVHSSGDRWIDFWTARLEAPWTVALLMVRPLPRTRAESNELATQFLCNPDVLWDAFQAHSRRRRLFEGRRRESQPRNSPPESR